MICASSSLSRCHSPLANGWGLSGSLAGYVAFPARLLAGPRLGAGRASNHRRISPRQIPARAEGAASAASPPISPVDPPGFRSVVPVPRCALPAASSRLVGERQVARCSRWAIRACGWEGRLARAAGAMAVSPGRGHGPPSLRSRRRGWRAQAFGWSQGRSRGCCACIFRAAAAVAGGPPYLRAQSAKINC